MRDGGIDKALEMLGDDREYLVPGDIEEAYGSWLEVTDAARRLADSPMEAQIANVLVNYLEDGIDKYGHVKKVAGTFEFELTVMANNLTLEQIQEHAKNKTRFKLVEGV